MSLFLKKYDWHRVKLIGLRHGPSTPFVLVNGPSLKVFSWMVWHKSNLFRRALFVLQSLTLALHGPMLINSSLLILFIFPDWGRQQSTFVTGLVRFFRQLFGVLSLESNEALLARLVPFVLPRGFRHPQSRAFEPLVLRVNCRIHRSQVLPPGLPNHRQGVCGAWRMIRQRDGHEDASGSEELVTTELL